MSHLNRQILPTLSVLATLGALVIYLVAGEELTRAVVLVLRVGGVSLATAIVAACLLSLIYLAWLVYQKSLVALEARRAATAQRQLIEARARREQREAEVMVVTARADEQVFIRDAGHTLWRAGHLDPRIYANGVPGLPSPLEVMAWQSFHGKSAGETPPATSPLLLGPGGALPERIDLQQLMPGGRGSLRNIIVGVRLDEAGQLRTVSIPLTRMVHVGAAGATDSGKSNFGRAIAVQVATAPEEVSLVFVDLKQTTFKIFRDMPRLRYPLVTTPADFMAVMDDLARELERRKQLFKSYLTVETLVDYNRVAGESLPVIVVFVDEVTNLFMDPETRRTALRMIRECRAFGMNFITLGQSWSHKEMDTSFREQHRTTGHFGTNNPHSSRMMLNSPEAANITTPGRAYFALPFGMSRGIVEIQTPYLDPETALRLLPAPTTVPPAMPSGRPGSTATAPTEPNDQEQKILALAASGTSFSAIARQVFEADGGNQLKKVRQVLAKFQAP